jgi:hypothetical protein
MGTGRRSEAAATGRQHRVAVGQAKVTETRRGKVKVQVAPMTPKQRKKAQEGQESGKATGSRKTVNESRHGADKDKDDQWQDEGEMVSFQVSKAKQRNVSRQS